ncbi:MAG TPA: zf-HC2 domain-containing protein, partial [Gemmatimonadaceae bacterium]|nr:zf-HC2 domain-containing protein [Gemmatimonadaceae bacterium]
MTDPTMNCDEFADQLADFLERDLNENTRAAMEAHALECGECGPLLADLRRLRIDAANLPELAPSRDLWRGIADRIETPVVALPRRGGGVTPNVSRRIWFGLAAAALVAITATVTREITRRSIESGRSTTVAT